MKINLTKDNCAIYEEWRDYIATYNDLAILDLSNFDNSVDCYIKEAMNPTARNRWRFSKRFYSTDIKERNQHLDCIYTINTSAPKRQGKPMRQHYQEYPKPTIHKLDCVAHNTVFFGCYMNIEPTKLLAYITAQVCGEMMAITQIIGHAHYLNDGIMLNALAKAVEYALANGIKAIVYSRWKDGTDGLRHWKYSVGFKSGKLTETC